MNRKIISAVTLVILMIGLVGFAAVLPARADVITTNDNSSMISYSTTEGDWTYQTNQAVEIAINSDYHFSNVPGAYAEFPFTGTSITLISMLTPDGGTADIYIDNTLDQSVDLYSDVAHHEVEVYRKDGLTQGPHTIKVEVSASKNAASTDYKVVIDAFKSEDGTNRYQTPTPDPAHLIHLDSFANYVQGTGVSLSGNSTSTCNIAAGQNTDMLICSSNIHEVDVGNPQGGNFNLAVSAHPMTGTLFIYYRIDVVVTSGVHANWAMNFGLSGTTVPAIGTMTLTGSNPGIAAGITTDGPFIGNVTGTVIITLSLQPIQSSGECYKNYFSSSTNGPFVIDPTIEFPLGKTGSPPDEQIYGVVGEKTYGVRIGGDPWHDGTAADRKDVAYSWDNITWTALSSAPCVYNEPAGNYFYTAFINSPIGATTLYLRANDLTGQFADNYMDAGKHLLYYVSLEQVVGLDACGYMVMTTAGPYDIIPYVEFPAGPTGTPYPDDQIYPTVQGAFYGIKMSGGAWLDGESTTHRYDASISWDGTTWTPLVNASLCSVPDPNDSNFATYYVRAVSATFHIRVNDKTAFMGTHYFADNTLVDSLHPFQYSISLAIYVGIPDCSSQFAYDPLANFVTSVSLPANTSYTPATDALVPGDWYVIQVASGSWQDGGVPPDLYSAQFSFGDQLGQPTLSAIYHGLESTGAFVYCVKTDGNYATAFIQAGGSNLYLRVEDLAGIFTNNTGHLGINIYHASYTHRTAGCELQFGLDNLYYQGNVSAVQENGVVIGASVFFGNNNVISNISSTTTDYKLEAGQWYMLETIGGPWGWVGDTHVNTSYDAAVSDDGTRWVALQDWAFPVCNVSIDALGHRRVYFQVPTDKEVTWSIRVNDTTSWSNNFGSIGYTLYKAYNQQVSLPDGSCDYKYDQNHPINGPAPILIDAKISAGVAIMSVLEPNKIYAFLIHGNPYHWIESTGGPQRFDAQISDDDGSTWHTLPSNYGGVMCYIQNEYETVIFISTGQHYLYKMRVNSTSFDDNTGALAVDVFSANTGDTINPWVTCLDGLSKTVIDPHIPIDITKFEGQNIPLPVGYTNDATVLGFVAEIEYGWGPWHKNDGSPNDDHYDAEISVDNAATWGQMDDKSYSDLIQCAGIDRIHRYKYVYFKNDPGTDPANPTHWKIRVNDDTQANYPGHTGNLAYVLYAVTEVNNTPPCLVDTNNENCNPPGPPVLVDGQDVCTMVNVLPTISLDIGQDFQDVASWAVIGISQFMAICPQHIDALWALMNIFASREPMATINDLQSLIKETQKQLTAYQWYDPNDPEDLMATSANGASFTDAVFKKMFPPMSSSNPLNGGKLLPSGLNLSSGDPTHYAYFNSCVATSADFLGDYLPKGVCMISLWWRETGVSLWLQMIFDIMIAGAVIKRIRKQAQKMANMMAGISTADIDVKQVVNIAGKFLK